MSDVTANPPLAESKTAKRKKNKGTDSVSNIIVPKTEDGTEAAVNGNDNENPYVKELQKTVRNLRKKLANTEKAQAIVGENAGKSWEELLAERKLNADQMKQLENKPTVEAQLKQTEEQLVHFRKFDEEWEQRAAKRVESERQGMQKEHALALEAKEKDVDKGKAELEKEFKARLLMLSRFLRTAAARRQMEEKQPENDAFEGVLLQLYGGDASAVEAMQNLINGAAAGVNTVEGEASGYTFAQIHDIVKESTADMDVTEPAAHDTAIESDPTMVNATLTEMAEDIQLPTEGTETRAVPEAATVGADAANAAAINLSSPQDLTASGTSDTWVEVRNPDETDTGFNATPAAITNQESWAEDVPVDAAVVQPANDGFTDVKHGRGGRGRGRGGRGRGEGFRGRGRGGGFRGDGEYRGRGRGRGGYRGRGGGPPGGDAGPVQS